MGFRFRRSIRILPGVSINLGKTGVSTSIGVPGAHVTLGHGKVRQTVGLPGTGLSYTETSDLHRAATEQQAPAEPVPQARPSSGWWVVVAALLAVIGYLLLTRAS